MRILITKFKMEQLITHIENISINITIPDYQEYNAFTNNDRRLTHTQWNMKVPYEKYILFDTRKLYFRKRLLFLRRKVVVNHFNLIYDAYHISTYFTSSVWGILLAVESVGSLCITIEPMKRKITHWGFLSS